jgi:hypothetical protein
MSQPWYSQMSPESYSRYILLARLLESGLGHRSARILELGGKGTYIHEIFHDLGLPYELTVLDILPKEDRAQGYHYLQGDAINTGLPSQSFDAVISTDTLEHVASTAKAAFIDESMRLARHLVIIAAPFETPGVVEAERRANGFYRQLTGQPHPWLSEHEAAGRPSTAEIERAIRTTGHTFVHFGSNRLDTWLLSLVINLLPERVTVDHTKIGQLNEFYNQHMLSIGDFTAPTYRQFYAISLDGHTVQVPAHTADPHLLEQYKQGVQAFIADELSSRYSRIASEPNAHTWDEIKALKAAQKFAQSGLRSAFNAGLGTTKKVVRHPIKTIRYLKERLHKR